ncbi:DNA topoisomerase 2-like isoform X1 [Salvia splendens]|uniref:DNA topoisomerase 2-like isoform X1 n=1 Tax=Salvia splendens TaxID=180675 RepID=UPI001C273A55|nr:DNA topoisomerase 2-like isoform X1 [Salvia splendens]
MAGAKKAPLTSSNNANIPPPETAPTAGTKKTIEQMYQKKSQLEHILLRPDTYIGSVEKHTQNLWVYDNDQMVQRSVTYVPGLYKIFDEILVNAADNKQRDPKMDSVKVTIDVESNTISVYNTGDGIPVEIHQEEGVYVPELIFGHLLTSSNYDDDEKKTTGGRNGYGAKLTNIFSTEFVVETADGKRQKKYKQVFSNNMGVKSEPTLSKCRASENWTKITFKPDLAKFSMTCLEDDVVALMKKRVIDVAGCLGKTVKVELNGQMFQFKTFSNYCELYLKSVAASDSDPLPRFEEHVHDRWQICISRSDGQFQQVSFVNGIATTKGGTHVDYVTNKIASHLVTVINNKNKKSKSFELKPHNVKNHLWVFVNALIDNPAFDSQTKETLTLRAGSFGSSWDFTSKFLDKVAKSDIMKNIEEWAEFKQQKDLKKTDGSKNKRVLVEKHSEAHEWGKKEADQCTLILTEGDSAKALAIAGLTIIGKRHYGVFPLRGKLLNVREASHTQIMQNAEFTKLKQILGLQHGVKYDDNKSLKSLKYGHVMIMTDQDHDGSHIKGLLINLFHSFWPALLKVPSFLLEFITPIVKAKHRDGRRIEVFYTMPQYEAWKERLGPEAKNWTIKYYKGLGTSTGEEAKEYFRDLEKHKKDFVWENDEDGEAIELAFSKKKIEARKSWLRQFEPGTFLDDVDKHIKYRDFVHKELILFSIADVQRSIPSMVDGLKPGQRKILFCSFKRNFIKEAKVAQFCGYVSEHSAYHHGEQSLAGTIIGMAQDFVGSNNINLLLPNGQFGTRGQGGKDHASSRYIYTQLAPVTRFLFPKADDILLNYLNEDGQSIEPTWYIPIIPMVLVNGSEGIGTGWSSFVPNYNPFDIIRNIRHLLNDEPMEAMHPWYKGFIGSIEKNVTKDTGSYTVCGNIEEVDENTLRITELPIRKWTQDYKEFLESVSADNDKSTDPFIKEFCDNSGGEIVHFSVCMSEEKLPAVKQEGLLKKLKLSTSISTSNMHLFDSRGVIKKYDTPEQILEEFFYLRLEFYDKRKKAVLANLEKEMLKCDNKCRFIQGVVEGSIIVSNRKRADLVLELKAKGFTPFPKKENAPEVSVAGASNDAEESEESSEVPIGQGVSSSDYDYLLLLSINTLTLEKMQELLAEREKRVAEVEDLKSTSVKMLWMRDIDALEAKLVEELNKYEKKWEEDRKRIHDGAYAKGPQKNPRKKTQKTTTKKEPAEDPMEVSQNTMPQTDKAAEVKKPRGRAPAKKKAPAAKVTSTADEDEDEISDLRQRMAAYNFNSSPDRSEDMESEVSQVPTNNQAAKRDVTKKTTLSSVSEIDDSDDDIVEIIDDDFETEEKKKKGGRKPANGKAVGKPPPAATKKRAPASKKPQLVGQKLITQVLKPAEVSPDKKVRKMRASPFNKKSGSILGRTINVDDDEEEDASEASASTLGSATDAAPSVVRPKRANRAQMKYVISDSESDQADDDDDTAHEEDSDFNDDED